MKRGNQIKLSGNRIHKRHYCDELISCFHKKLKIDELPIINNDEEGGKQLSSMALILYKEPSTTLPVGNLPKDVFDKLSATQYFSSDPIIISKNNLNLEKILQIETNEDEARFEENNELEMVLD